MRRFVSVAVILLLTGVSFVRNSFWRDDAGIWGDAITKSPLKSRGYNELGLSLITRGEHHQAHRLLRRSLQLDPYQGPIYINLGLAFEHLGMIDDAVRTYQNAVWVQPADPTAYYNLGVLYYRTLKDRDKAFGYFLKARDLEPTEPDAHKYLSFIYDETGDPVKAREERALYERYRHR